MADDFPSDSRPDSSEEWIDRIASSEGIPRDEVIDRMVSSYWTLKEVQEMIGETRDESERPGRTEEQSELEAEVAELQKRLDRLEAGADQEEIGPADELRGKLKMLTQRIEAVENRLDERQTALESRLDEELENLSTVLDYLIETTDDLEKDVEAVINRQEDLREHAHEERLTNLKRLASRLGVRTAQCEYCDTSVDIGLLPSPECPQCDRRFVDIDPATGWFGFSSNTLEVSAESYIESED